MPRGTGPSRSFAAAALAAAVFVLGLAACADPSRRTDELASTLGFERRIVPGAGFRHVVYARPGADDGGPLHVYLEGDGTPWVHGRYPAADPTPREPLALRLMARDPAPALLVSRPCYHGLRDDPGCGPELWTDARYSEAVVASMAAALTRAAGPGRGITLIGYSGGGALAMLLAERVPGVEAVVTVAGNLDVAGWARLHGYQLLASSLDPALRPALPERIRQLHLAGAQDSEVPPALAAAVAARQPRAAFRTIPGFDHRCCWVEAWPGPLIGGP